MTCVQKNGNLLPVPLALDRWYIFPNSILADKKGGKKGDQK